MVQYNNSKKLYKMAEKKSTLDGHLVLLQKSSIVLHGGHLKCYTVARPIIRL